MELDLEKVHVLGFQHTTKVFMMGCKRSSAMNSRRKQEGSRQGFVCSLQISVHQKMHTNVMVAALALLLLFSSTQARRPRHVEFEMASLEGTITTKSRDHIEVMNAHNNSAMIRRQLKSMNKQPVRSIQSPDGDIIDCVPQNKQPAFDHPQLQSHKFEKYPSSIPTATSSRPPRHRIRHPIAVPQAWHHNGSCPAGTIPVRRTSEEDLTRWASSPTRASSYGTKTHKPARSQARNYVDDPSTASITISGDGSDNHEHAIAYVENTEVYGASAVLSVWDPWVEASNEFSLAQLWILGGSFDNDLNSIEAGWQVSPELYGDGRPRLFIYWTTDGYQATGCYNLLCSGFVQTSETVAIGAAIAPVSNYGGSQYQIEIMIWKDPRQGNWWMAFEGSHIVGYWPAELFSHLSEYAAGMVEWGGEVVNSRPYGHHTATQMGSGRFAEGGFGSASFFHSLQVVDGNNNLQQVGNLQTLAENPNCYDIKSMQDPTWGASFYFGGPGHNSLCE